MLLAFVVQMMCLPALYVAGTQFAKLRNIPEPEIIGLLSALVPPVGAFCAATLIMRDFEGEDE